MTPTQHPCPPAEPVQQWLNSLPDPVLERLDTMVRRASGMSRAEKLACVEVLRSLISTLRNAPPEVGSPNEMLGCALLCDLQQLTIEIALQAEEATNG